MLNIFMNIKKLMIYLKHVTALFSGSAKYLWGLSKSTKTPCPVRTYLSVGIAVSNHKAYFAANVV